MTHSHIVLIWPRVVLKDERRLPHTPGRVWSCVSIVFNELPLSLCFFSSFFLLVCVCVCVCTLRYPFNPDARSHPCCFHSSVCVGVSDDKHSSGRVWALMSSSLVAASLLSWNNARDVHVYWCHFHLETRVIKLSYKPHLHSRSFRKKHIVTGPFFKCWYSLNRLSWSVDLSEDGIYQAQLSRNPALPCVLLILKVMVADSRLFVACISSHCHCVYVNTSFCLVLRFTPTSHCRFDPPSSAPLFFTSMGCIIETAGERGNR